MATARIDLNADLGESFGSWRMGDDLGLLDIVTSANVACGFHAGDPAIMVDTATAAKARGVAIGAHPGFFDLRGFGRRPLPETPRTIERDVAYQIGAMQACAALGGHRVTYVKAHGALANLSNTNEDIAVALARAVVAVDRTLAIVVMPGLPVERAGERAGLRCVREIYGDRAYAEDGTLAPRSQEGAVIDSPDAIAERVRSMVEEQVLLTVSGKRIRVAIETICVHGDNPGAVGAARAVRRTLESAGLTLAPFAPA